MKRTLAFAIGWFVLMVSSIEAGHTLTGRNSRVLASWLATHPHFRVAGSADCGCIEDVERMRKGSGGRWAPVRDYAPYLATGDFNSDGQTDFAVIVVDTSRPSDRSFTLLVFNGPFQGVKASPALMQRDLDMRGKGLFFGAPRPKPHRLVVGAFESEGAMLVPVGSSYRLAHK